MARLQLIRKVALTSGGRAATAIISLLLAVLISRLFGPSVTGKFYLTITIAVGCVVFARLGLETALLRLIGAIRDTWRAPAAKRALVYTLIVTSCLALAWTVLVAVVVVLLKSGSSGIVD
ncbi:hypothetical protein JYU02_01220, partial [bacterium AH-315-P15]|nr:hypothetical protein [bacterium AH-315-P15]